MDASAGVARSTNAFGSCETVRPARNNAAGGGTSAPVADSDRKLSDWWAPASKGVGGSVSGMARFTAFGREQCRRGTTPVLHPTASIQLGADAVRSFQRRDHTAQ